MLFGYIHKDFWLNSSHPYFLLCRLSSVFLFDCVELLLAKEEALFELSWMIAKLTFGALQAMSYY